VADDQQEAPEVEGASEQGKRRARRLLELEFGKTYDFDDPKHEWRRLFSELLGTFFLVLVGAGGAVVNAQSDGAISRAAAVTAPGLMVMAIILFMGAVSGAHLNPAVSIAFAARGDFPWRRVPGYVIVQLLGATLACLFLWAILGKLGMLGAAEPGPGISATQAMLMELILTVGLVSTILGTASGAQNISVFGALGVGGYIILAGLWSSPISGASMNPARSFGPTWRCSTSRTTGPTSWARSPGRSSPAASPGSSVVPAGARAEPLPRRVASARCGRPTTRSRRSESPQGGSA